MRKITTAVSLALFLIGSATAPLVLAEGVIAKDVRSSSRSIDHGIKHDGKEADKGMKHLEKERHKEDKHLDKEAKKHL